MTLPTEVQKSLTLLGENLRVARTRRKETQEQFAKRIGCRRQSVADMEKGLTSVSFETYAMALWAIGMADDLAELAHPDRDIQGRVAERENDPQRVHTERRNIERYNF